MYKQNERGTVTYNHFIRVNCKHLFINILDSVRERINTYILCILQYIYRYVYNVITYIRIHIYRCVSNPFETATHDLTGARLYVISHCE